MKGVGRSGGKREIAQIEKIANVLKVWEKKRTEKGMYEPYLERGNKGVIRKDRGSNRKELAYERNRLRLGAKVMTKAISKLLSGNAGSKVVINTMKKKRGGQIWAN